MAEMTAAEVVAWLTEDKAFGQECYSRKQIAQLIQQQQRDLEYEKTNHQEAIHEIEQQQQQIEQQAQTIEALKLCWNCRHIEADRCNKHNRLVDFPMREKCDQWQVKEAQ